KKKIIVLDENVSAVKMLSDVLYAKGYSVVDALNTDELFTKIKSLNPDMIIGKNLFLNQPDLIKGLQFKNNLEDVFFILSNEDKLNDENKS
ncbi:MAG TPA: hypothetical protein V6D48_17770, partial [Oculatellaceae cyanobacterium]